MYVYVHVSCTTTITSVCKDRDDHYHVIYTGITRKLCPHCIAYGFLVGKPHPMHMYMECLRFYQAPPNARK